MTKEQAQDKAKQIADSTGNSVLVYRSTLPHRPNEYGVAFTLPTFGERIGDRIYPTATKFIDLESLSKRILGID